MYNNYSLIVSRYSNGLAYYGYIRQEYELAGTVVAAAKGYVAPGVSVIIRPNFNEAGPTGTVYFREWRSIDGSAFNECVWDTALAVEARQYSSAGEIASLLS